MDSLSQIVLGAAVGELMLGRRIGNKAMLLGAVGGTIPDLDILLNGFFPDPAEQLRIHRGYSHSMFVHILLALPFAWLSSRWIRNVPLPRMYLAWYLFFLTHALLDCCTTYGTQLLLPFSDYLVGFNNISVIDPLWTLPFLISLLACLFIRRNPEARMRWAWGGMAYALLYMAMTFANKWMVHRHFSSELRRQGIAYDQLSTSPSILNNVLWSGIAVSGDSLYVGEFSLFQPESLVEWVAYPRNTHLLDHHPAQASISALRWFSQGLCFAEHKGDTLNVYMCKWGRMNYTARKSEEAFVFYWKIVPHESGHLLRQAEREMSREDFSRALRMLWKRMFSSRAVINLTPHLTSQRSPETSY